MSGSSLSPFFSPLRDEVRNDPSSIEDSSLYSLSKLLSCPSPSPSSTRSLPTHGMMVKRETSVTRSLLELDTLSDSNITSGRVIDQRVESDHQYHSSHDGGRDNVIHKVNRRETGVEQEQVMECIRSKSWEEIIRIQDEFLDQSLPIFDSNLDVFKPFKIGLVIDGLVIPRHPRDVVKMFTDQDVVNGKNLKYQSVDDKLKEQLILSSMLTSPSRATSGQPFKSHDILFGFRTKDSWLSLMSDRPRIINSIQSINSSTIDPVVKSLIKNSFQYYQEVRILSSIF